MKLFNRKNRIPTRRNPKQWIIEPRRKACACCATEKLEWQEEQKNIGTCKSN